MSKKITGAIFANTSGNPKAPSFKGNIEIDGEKISIVLWKKTSKSEMEYYSINNDEREAKKENGLS